MIYDWKDKIILLNDYIVPIGAETVKKLLEEGVKHITILDVDEEAGESLQEELNKKYSGNKVKFIKCDVTDEDQLMKSYQAIIDEHGYIDVVVNHTFMVDDSKEGYKKMIDFNFTTPVTSTLKSIEIMSKENGGRGGTVINKSSFLALTQSHLLPIYTASKSAILQFSNCIGRQEYYARTGVRVITIMYGTYDAPMAHPSNIRSFDKHVEASFNETLSFPLQRKKSLVQGLVDAYKQAESGSTWISTNDRPVKDITATVKMAYDLLSVHVFE